MPRYIKTCTRHSSLKRGNDDCFVAFKSAGKNQPCRDSDLFAPVIFKQPKKASKDEKQGPISPLREAPVGRRTISVFSQSKQRMLEINTDKIRWRNALDIYNQLDVWDQGYIDVRDAARLLHGIPKTNITHLERLVSILEDLEFYVSSRGVVEKDVAVQAIKRAIDESGLANSVYSALRVPQRASNTGRSIGLHVTHRPFYKNYRRGFSKCGEYCNTEYLTNCAFSPATLCRPVVGAESITKTRKIPHEELWGAVNAGLAEHGRITKERSQRKTEELRKEQERMENEAMKVKHLLHNNINKPGTKGIQRKELLEAIDLVAPEYIYVDMMDREAEKQCSNSRRILAPDEPKVFKRYLGKDAPEWEKNLSEMSHFILHPGDPPAVKSTPWEDSLRDDSEHKICEIGCSLNDLRMWEEKEKKHFDAFSRIIPDGQEECRAPVLPKSRRNWTPTMAFHAPTAGRSIIQRNPDPSRSDIYSKKEDHQFSAPYMLDYTTSNRSALGVSRSAHESVLRTLVMPQRSGLLEDVHNQHLPDHKTQEQIITWTPSMQRDLLLLNPRY